MKKTEEEGLNLEKEPLCIAAWYEAHRIIERYTSVCFVFYFLFMAVLALHCGVGFSLVVESRGCSPVVGQGLLISVVSPVGHRPQAA